MIMIVLVLRTKPFGLYRNRRGLGLHRGGLQRRRSTSGSPSLSSTPRRVPSGHGTKSSILYLHSPTVRPKYIVRLSGYPLIQDSLRGGGGGCRGWRWRRGWPQLVAAVAVVISASAAVVAQGRDEVNEDTNERGKVKI